MDAAVPFHSPVVVALPIADRRESYRFYQEALGLTAVGELASDGVPEPLRFVVNDGLHLMLVPSGGFGWVIGPHEVAPRGQSECLLNLGFATSDEVDRAFERVRGAGAETVTEPSAKPWGYTGVFADPDGHLWELTAPVAD
ncbi:VOC family protein [Micromonospora sp. NBRC 101691]|uniref:VOC family protein n=1 Tax=Micromonospora sp. NBRC 101691 TaxID=3032198 RepID=UPI0024A40DB0|nr:VOC family protein [Micromonospora sp. NBRC 101691]GLY25750.1 glyoxalase [Micromonospora sp. NBRC 101691]